MSRWNNIICNIVTNKVVPQILKAGVKVRGVSDYQLSIDPFEM